MAGAQTFERSPTALQDTLGGNQVRSSVAILWSSTLASGAVTPIWWLHCSNTAPIPIFVYFCFCLLTVTSNGTINISLQFFVRNPGFSSFKVDLLIWREVWQGMSSIRCFIFCFPSMDRARPEAKALEFHSGFSCECQGYMLGISLVGQS